MEKHAAIACVLVFAGCVTAILAATPPPPPPSDHSSPPATTLWDARAIVTAGVLLAVAYSVARFTVLHLARFHGEYLHALLVRNGNRVHLVLISVQILLQLHSESDPAVMMVMWCFVLCAMSFVALFGDQQLIREVSLLVVLQAVITAVGFALYHSLFYSVLAVIPVAMSVALWVMFNNL